MKDKSIDRHYTSKELQTFAPVDLELKARRLYLEELMTPDGYHIVSELVRRLQQESCRCIRVINGSTIRILTAADCPFHAGMIRSFIGER